MILSILGKINSICENAFEPIDNLIEKLPFDDWVIDAVIDSIHLLPFLFFIFVVIEILEFHYSHKINSTIAKAKKRSVFISSLASIFPQCGFSVMASELYCEKIITRGCLIAVYLGTSDECLPILLANPEKAYLVIPVVAVKFVVAIAAGYFLDFIWRHFKKYDETDNNEQSEQISTHIHEAGCCHHEPDTINKRELILHPVFHTINIFIFILIITMILNYLLVHLPLSDILIKNTHSFIVCVFSALLGLIPNCAVSIAITMMLIKGHITFGAAMCGLLSNSGLGLLVLLKNNDFKDNLKIIGILLFISILSGVIIDLII